MPTRTQTTPVALPDGSSLMRIAFIALLAVSTTACLEAATETPGSSVGTLSGTVTLLGSGGPANAAGARITLYRAERDIETQQHAYDASLVPVGSASRSFAFDFLAVDRGEYYVIACFTFGCGGYRNPETGALLRVRVAGGGVTTLDFGV